MMNDPVTLQLLTWVIGIAGAGFGGSFVISMRQRANLHTRIDDLTKKVSESYVSKADIRDMEKRITAHLERVEDKVDWRNGKAKRT